MSIWKTDKLTLNKYECSVVVMMAIVLLPTFAVLVLQVLAEVSSGEKNNFRVYFITAVVFLLLLFLSGWLLYRYGREISLHAGLFKIICSGIFVCNLLLLALCYHTSPGVYPWMSGEWFPWHQKTEWKVFLFMSGIAVFGILFFLWSDRLKKLTTYMRYPVYLLASVAGGMSMYCGNYLASDKLHGTAYYTSVYNALMDAPYDFANQSIYGHYAIFLKYPIKLLGGSYSAYNLVIAVVGGLSILLFAITLDMCVRNHYISMIGTWSIPVMYLYYPLNHWQMFPHRVLFGGIELFLFIFLFTKQKRGMLAIGYAVCSMAMLWNMETGIVCLGVWCLAGVLYEESRSDTIGRQRLFFSIKCCIRNVAYSVFSVMGMLVMFNLYNMPLGEKWHGLRFLLYPHFSGWDMETLVAQAAEQAAGTSGIAAALDEIGLGFASTFSLSFSPQISSWYFVFLLFMACIVLVAARKIHGKANSLEYIMILSAVLALGHLVYFINHPCFDYLAIGFFEAVLIMGILADEAVESGSSLGLIKRAYQYLFIAIMSVLSVFAIWQTVYRISTRAELGYYTSEEFNELLTEIQETVPDNVIAIGTGSHEIYAQLGRDTGFYMMDLPDMDGNVHAVAQLYMAASQQKNYLISVWKKTVEDKISIEEYMSYWGVQPEAITVNEHWDMGYNSTSYSYWDIYYLEIDQSVEHTNMDYYGEIYQRDQRFKRK